MFDPPENQATGSKLDLKIELSTEPNDEREQVTIDNVSRINVSRQLANIKRMNRKK